MRVLVVEDGVRMAALIKRGLEEDGYAVEDRVRGPDAGAADYLVNQYVLHLRRKADRPFGLDQLETVRGAGYRLRTRPGKATAAGTGRHG